MTAGPFTFDEARSAAARASQAQSSAETALRQAASALAEAERRYRAALAACLVELRADGVAWSSTGDLARGDERVSELRRDRDVARAERELAAQALRRRAADRRDLERLVEWSMRRDPAARGHDHDDTPTNHLTTDCEDR